MAQINLLAGVSWAAVFERFNRRQSVAGGETGKILVVIPADWRQERTLELLQDRPAGCSVLTTEELIECYIEGIWGRQAGETTLRTFRKSAEVISPPRILLDRQAVAYLLDSILKESVLNALDSLKGVQPSAPGRPPSGYLNIETFRQGYLRALSDYIYEFRQTHYEDLSAVLERLKAGMLSARELDLVNIHNEFEGLLEQRGLYDYRRAVETFLAESRRDAEPGPLLQPKSTLQPETSLVVAGFSRLTSLDRRLLLALVSRFQQSTILYCSNPGASAAVFRVQESLESFLRQLRECPAGIREQRLEEECAAGGSHLLPLAECMFQDDKEGRLFRDSGTVRLIQAEDRYAEVTSMARKILELGRQGVDYDRIRLIFSDYELYTAILLEVFPRYGIPFRLDRGAPLAFFPLTGLVRSLVAQALSPNPYPLREKIFSSVYVSYSCRVEPEELERFVREKHLPVAEGSIRGALPQARSFDLDYRYCLEQQRRAAQVVKSEEKLEPLRLAARYLEERFARDQVTLEREMLRLAINYYVLARAERSLYPWRSKMTASAFCRCLQKLLDRFQVVENALSREGFEDEVFQSVAARDEQILETLKRLFERFQDHFRRLSGEGPGMTTEDTGGARRGGTMERSGNTLDSERQYPLLTLAGAFTAMLSDPDLALPAAAVDPGRKGAAGAGGAAGVPSDPQGQGASEDQGARETRGVTVFASADVPVSFYPVTLIGGLVDGEFPAREPFNFLAPRKEAPGGGTTPDESTGGESLLIDGERQNLYQIITSTTERLYLYAPYSEGGKKLLASPFVAEIERCLAAAASGSREPQRSPRGPEYCWNTREKLIVAGRNLDRRYQRALPVLQDLKSAFGEDSGERFRHILDIFRCDGLRGSPETLGRFDGIFDSAPEPDSASARSISRQMEEACPVEVEQLERYAACPLRFLLDDLMHLKPEHQVDYHPDRTERGELIKTILLRYSEQETGAPASGWTMPQNAEQLLRAVAEQAFARQPSGRDDLFSGSFRRSLLRGLAEAAPVGGNGAGGSPGSPGASGGVTAGSADSGGSGKRRPGLLSTFLDHERHSPDLIRPYLASLRLDDFRTGDLPVRIAVERADITSDGKYLIIYTYSITDPGNLGGINKGLLFQAPLSILALRGHLRRISLDQQVGGAGVYLVRNPRMIKRCGYFALLQLRASRRTLVSPEQPLFSGQRQYGFLPSAHFEHELQEAERRVGRIAELIRKGRFNPPLCAIRDQICPNCAFSRICRKDQLRLDRIYTTVGEAELYKPRRVVQLPEHQE